MPAPVSRSLRLSCRTVLPLGNLLPVIHFFSLHSRIPYRVRLGHEYFPRAESLSGLKHGLIVPEFFEAMTTAHRKKLRVANEDVIAFLLVGISLAQ